MAGNINIFLAFTAGLISFFSPCVLPLIPSYLSYLGGISYRELVEKKNNRRGLFINASLFVVGFTLVFVVLGIFFSGLGRAFSNASQVINLVAGSIVIVLGLNFIFNFIKILNLEKRLQFKQRPRGYFGSVLLGMAFGAGWTPCIGPILGSILFLAGTSGTILQGSFLLIVYSLGLGLPFILGGLFFSAFQQQLVKIKPLMGKIRIFSGLFLILIGVLILSGSLSQVNIFFFKLANALVLWHEAHPGVSRIISGSLLLGLTGLGLFFYLRRLVRLRQAGQAGQVKWITLLAPLRLFLLLSLLALAVTSYAGLWNVSLLLSSWFNFQGL